LDHGGNGLINADTALAGVRAAIRKVDPAGVESVDHLHAGRWILIPWARKIDSHRSRGCCDRIASWRHTWNALCDPGAEECRGFSDCETSNRRIDAGSFRRLMEELIAHARKEGRHTMVGGIDIDNQASIRLDEQLAFVHAGTIRHAGFKFGRWLDLGFYQYTLESPASPIEG